MAVSEPILVDIDPRKSRRVKAQPVIMRIDVPPKATSKGWGDMSWLKSRN